ncbi:MAG: divergent polysaccharide deacetylase family protein [Candidatus Marinimicrobia bacterium]|nr:divergent polysaccharide deacetylase family protein [Candidatus Neomarinimicrobiota bacterium]
MYIKYFKNNFLDVKKIVTIFLLVIILLIISITFFINDDGIIINKKYSVNKSFVFEKLIPSINSNLFNFVLENAGVDSSANIRYYNYTCNNDSLCKTDIHQLVKYLNSFNLQIVFSEIDDNKIIIDIIDNNNEPYARIFINIRKTNERIDKKTKATSGKITIIVDDFGYYDNSLSKQFLKLDKNIVFSIIPGHQFSAILAKKMHKADHEVLIHLPMEPIKYNGGEKKYIIMEKMNSKEIDMRINNAIDELQIAIGINNHMGSKATSDRQTMEYVASAIRGKKLLFVDSYTYNKSVAYQVMKENNISTARRNIFIDNENDSIYIAKQIDKLIILAKKNGKALGIGHAKKMTLKVLQEKIPEIINKGIEIIPITEFVKLDN